MAIIKGKIVSLDYEGKLENGEVFDSSQHGDHSHPLEFEVGAGHVIPGFDEAVLGMELGQEKEFEIEPENAYGHYREELKKQIPKQGFQRPLDEQGNPVEPQVGMVLGMKTPQGQMLPVKISAIDDQNITLDLNHPLAGKKLLFKIKILEIKDKPEEEAQTSEQTPDQTQTGEQTQTEDSLEDLADNEKKE